MTKNECLERAARARHESKVAAESAALYALTFGGNDKLTQDAFLRSDVAAEAAKKWEQIAEWNPATRNAAMRKQQLPAFIFGY